ncbi:MAG: metallophosphoesterase, partial [Tepidisphaeraceae bacterium]
MEAARLQIQYANGASGKRHRKYIKPLRPLRSSTDDWKQHLPEAMPREPWKPLDIKGPTKTLILSDVHIPFHDTTSLALAIEYGVQHDADTVILNGDIMDHYALSRFLKDPRVRDFPGEVRLARQFLKALRKAFPKARIIWKHGNHEERYENYMRAMAPDFIGVDAFEWANVFSLSDFGVEMVGDKRTIRLGKIHVLHGHEYGGGIYAPVAASRSMFLKALS